jgi:hypothetical protein
MTSSEAETEEEDGCQQKISKKNKNENDVKVKPTLRYIPEVGNINFFFDILSYQYHGQKSDILSIIM